MLRRCYDGLEEYSKCSDPRIGHEILTILYLDVSFPIRSSPAATANYNALLLPTKHVSSVEMSWKYAGHLLSGPPSSSTPSNSGPSSIPKHLRPNTNGLNAFQRERQLSTHYKAFDGPAQIVRSEWDVLKENHRYVEGRLYSG